MVDRFSAGNVTVTVSDPYPCWIHIQQGEDNFTSSRRLAIPHTEIGDLIAMLQRAQQAARLQLTAPNKQECD